MEVNRLWTYRDVASFLGCCVRHVRDAYVKTGLLKRVPLGRRGVRFRVEDVDQLVATLAKGRTDEGE